MTGDEMYDDIGYHHKASIPYGPDQPPAIDIHNINFTGLIAGWLPVDAITEPFADISKIIYGIP
jgi:hypothetical protein